VTLGYFDGFETRGPWVRGLARLALDMAREEPLLTRPEVAERLACSTTTVSREIARGQLDCTRVGGRILVAQAEVDRYLENAKRGEP